MTDETEYQKDPKIVAFSERLKGAMETAGLSREEFAEKMGVGLVSVHSWTEGYRMMGLSRIETAAEVLGIRPGYLAFGDKG